MRDETDEHASAPDDEVTGADPSARPPADADQPPGADAEEDPQTTEAEAQATAPTGTPGIPAPAGDDRRNEEGLAMTTTTGDPAKDFRGPTVTEESREQLDEPALDAPGYADLGHAEDHRLLDD